MKSAIMATASLAAMVVSTPALASTYGASANGNTATNDQVGGVCFYADINYAGKESCYVIKDGELSKDFDLPSADVNTYSSYKTFGNVTIKALDGVTRATSQYTTFFGGESSADMGAFSNKMDFITIEENTVCLYRSTNQSGDRRCYGENNPETGNTGTWSSYRAFGNRTAVIYHALLYGDVPLELSTGAATGNSMASGNFTAQGVGSIEVGVRPAACLYTAENFTGTEFCYFDDVALLPDSIRGVVRSVRAPGDYDVWLYKNDNFANAYGPVRLDTRSVDANIQSGVGLRVIRRDEVCFYRHVNFEDEAECSGPTNGWKDVNSGNNDQFSSVITYGKAAVRVGEHPVSWGLGLTSGIMGAMHDFAGYDDNDWMNDRISSYNVNIEPRPGVCFYMQYRYSGNADCIPRGAQNPSFDTTFTRFNTITGIMHVGNSPIWVDGYQYANFDTSAGRQSWLSRYVANPTISQGLDIWPTIPDNDLDSAKVSAYDHHDYSNSNLTLATMYLDLQREDSLGNKMPFLYNTRRATHNTFNAASIMGTNNWIEGYNQLVEFGTLKDWGIRVIEMDTYGKDKVCHSPECGAIGKRTEVALQGTEIRAFARNASMDDFLHLYYESYDSQHFVDGSAARDAANAIKRSLFTPIGSFLWSPPGNCSAITDIKISTEAMINRGKRVIVYSSGTDCGNYEAVLKDQVFVNGQSPGLEANDFVVGADYKSIQRVQETNQQEGSLFGSLNADASRKVLANENLVKVERQGAKYVAMDLATDGRIGKTRWGWRSETDPAGSPNDTAHPWGATFADNDGYFEAAGLGQYGRAMCRKENGDWFVTARLDPNATNFVQTAISLCTADEGQFDVPLNAYEVNKAMAKVAAASDADSIYYYNYKRINGRWVTGAFGPLSTRLSTAP